MYPEVNAARFGDRPAVVMAGSGEQVTHRQLNQRSNRLAQLLHAAGLRRGDVLAVMLDNRPEVFDCYWAAIRSGLYLTPINSHLTAGEAAYIVEDAGATALVVSAALGDVAARLGSLVERTPVRLSVAGRVPGFDDYDSATAGFPDGPLDVETRGETMLYSSGTTGRPKGVKRPLADRPLTEVAPNAALAAGLWGVDHDTVYLSPAPLYHAAPLGLTTSVQSWGGTAIVMDRFDPVDAIRCIDDHLVTHSQWVPTMFVRMLKLDREIREELDGGRHRVAIHAAAPCPVEVKRRMIDWWGPILYEYYAGTEMNGFVHCTSPEWLAHPGTVGRPLLGAIHICGDDGQEVPVGSTGVVYFERDGATFEYHNDPDTTRRAQHPAHPNWTTLGDIGHLDDDGYLYLTDRQAFMIISGGVNIYPQEVENELIGHVDVLDAAVVGVPDDDLGERAVAVVQPVDGAVRAGLEERLRDWLHGRVAAYKAPRQYVFVDALPRLPTGKLSKEQVRRTLAAGDGP